MAHPIDIASGLQTAVEETSAGTSELVNWRVDASGANIPRPPLVAYTLSGINADTTVIGAHEWRGDLYLVGSDRWIYRVAHTTPNVAQPLSLSGDVTTTLGGSARPMFAEDPSDLFIAGGGRITRVSAGVPVASRFTTGPANATHIASLGQRLVANDRADAATRQQFFWSNAGDGNDATWGALAFATAEARPDEVVAIGENLAELFVFGESTVQVYSVGTDPNLPWDRVNTINFGCGAPYSITHHDSNFVFVDDSGRVVAFDGHAATPTLLSEAITEELRGVDSSDAWGWREREGRYDMIGLHMATAKRTYELDADRKSWAQRKKYDTDLQANSIMPIGCYAYWSKKDLHIFGRSDTNGIAKIDSSVGQELGGTLLCERTTGYSDAGTPHRKRRKRVHVTMRRGTAGPTATAGAIEVRVQDDGAAWSDWEPCDVGIEGDAETTAELFPGGVYYRGRYGIRYSGSDATALVSMVEDYKDLKAF